MTEPFDCFCTVTLRAKLMRNDDEVFFHIARVQIDIFCSVMKGRPKST